MINNILRTQQHPAAAVIVVNIVLAFMLRVIYCVVRHAPPVLFNWIPFAAGRTLKSDTQRQAFGTNCPVSCAPNTRSTFEIQFTALRLQRAFAI